MTEAKSWRDVIPIHPAAELFPRMSEPELRELGEDIRRNGMTRSIVVCAEDIYSPDEQYISTKWSVLDGRNRLDAMELAGIPFQLEYYGTGWHIEIDGVGGDLDSFPRRRHDLEIVRHGDPYAYVLSANLHRRHLTTDQKRDLIAKVIKAKPELSNRQVAAKTATSHAFVGKVRGELEQSGDVETVSTSIDTRGRKQPARKAAPAKSAAQSEELTGRAKVMAQRGMIAPDVWDETPNKHERANLRAGLFILAAQAFELGERFQAGVQEDRRLLAKDTIEQVRHTAQLWTSIVASIEGRKKHHVGNK
jgi:hypothetical protein